MVREKKKEKTERYFEGLGRRKTAVARVRLFAKKSGITVNGKNLKAYFAIPRLQKTVAAPLDRLGLAKDLKAEARVKGGGVAAQAEAVRHGLARALVAYDPEFRGQLRQAGFLTRDPRMVERKKYGFKKARRAPQWQKR